MVERLWRVAAVLDGEAEQVERVLAGSLDDDGDLAAVRRIQRRAHALEVAGLGLLAFAHHEVARHLDHARAALAPAAAPVPRLLRHHASPTPRCG